MTSNPSWTSSAVQADQGSKNNYFLVDAFPSKAPGTEVRPPPCLSLCPESPEDIAPSRSQRPALQDWTELFPIPESPDDPDPLCLHQACEGVMTDLYCNIQTYALQFWVPVDLLTAMITDRLVSKEMGVEPTPAIFFIPEKGKDHER